MVEQLAPPPRLSPPPAGYQEVYGFVGWIATLVAYVIYVIWAYLPESTLHALGVTYYPSKYWAIAVPSFLFVAVGCTVLTYVAANMMSTAPLNSFDTVTDVHARALDRSAWLQQDLSSAGADSRVPNIGDISIVMVNRLLYQNAGKVARPRSSAAAVVAARPGQRRRDSRPHLELPP